jgi:hypothetical protein
MLVTVADFGIELGNGAVHATQNVCAILKEDVDFIFIKQMSVRADGASSMPVLSKVGHSFAQMRVKQRFSKVMEPMNGHIMTAGLIDNFLKQA